MTITNLTPGTSYTFHLAAGNAVGFGKPIKFRVLTQMPQQMRGTSFKEQSGLLAQIIFIKTLTGIKA